MFSKEMQNALNEQINHEYYSSFLYLSMAAYFESVSWPGFAGWMQVQSEEEASHAKKFVAYVQERGGRVLLAELKAPPTEFKSIMDIFEQVYTHEKHVTALIHKLYALAIKDNDYAAQTFLHWFINEQVEEEANTALIVEQLKRVGESTGALFALDHQLSKRGGNS